MTVATDSLKSLSDHISSSLKTFRDYFGASTINSKDLVTGLFFGFIMLTLLLQLLAYYLRNGILFRISVGISFFIVLALFILASLTMILIIPLSDICMDPNNKILNLFSGQLAETLAYYITCEGSNPLDDDIQKLRSGLNNSQTILHQYKQYINTNCASMITSNFTAINNDVNNLAQLTYCDSINEIYSTAILKGVCTDGFAGLYNFWLVTFLVAAFMYVLMCLANIIYAHYDLNMQPISLNEDINESVDVEQQQKEQTGYEMVPIQENNVENETNHKDLQANIRRDQKVTVYAVKTTEV
eukprot:CAMPEP_0170070702 /NCGR_PEP_ID=MMETSP0019_2-20121128/8891_1 /TAXON_ID=98059 /ORGANISM="Dinobryon sp., Strain UTEXLB2267" /LENGTH=299 /DNA_ID=CAMNT_0010279039 /DNA_START=495 /DNA_END=1394 /DNA_ORIENTATION=+